MISLNAFKRFEGSPFLIHDSAALQWEWLQLNSSTDTALCILYTRRGSSLISYSFITAAITLSSLTGRWLPRLFWRRSPAWILLPEPPPAQPPECVTYRRMPSWECNACVVYFIYQIYHFIQICRLDFFSSASNHYITCHLADAFIQSDLQLIRLLKNQLK